MDPVRSKSSTYYPSPLVRIRPVAIRTILDLTSVLTASAPAVGSPRDVCGFHTGRELAHPLNQLFGSVSGQSVD